ncbi:MAG: hypothetical protein LBH29_01610 [Elusimicrobiota bacterium]|jgi:hypothetical protein|nr:hypothetical protein [Elusimicrobiota bacterium]
MDSVLRRNDTRGFGNDTEGLGLDARRLGFCASPSVVILTQETAALADVSPAGVAKHYAKQLELPSVIGGNSSIHFISNNTKELRVKS